MYNYQLEKANVLTPDGVKMLLAFRDAANKIAQHSTAIMMGDLMREAKTGGSSWTMMACVDFMVELGELREISAPDCAGQRRVFMKSLN